MTASPLERSYRRLLLAYPGSYRRRHGTEILTTLLEMSGPEQRRPHRADAWHLMASGIRQRFRLPARRPVAVLGAVLATLIVAAFGAAVGSWLGWQGAADLPDSATIVATTRTLGLPGLDRPDHIAGDPWTLAMGHSKVDATRFTTAQMSAVLAANGWRPVTGIEEAGHGTMPRTDSALPTILTWTGGGFVSVRDGVRLTVSTMLNGKGTSEAQLTFTAVEPAVVRPWVVAGAVLGGLLGWLVAVAVARRSRGRRTPALLSFAALLVLVPPALAVHGNTWRMFLGPRSLAEIEPAVHAAFTPGPYYPVGPAWQVLGMSIAGGVFALAALALAYRGPKVTADHEPVVQVDG